MNKITLIIIFLTVIFSSCQKKTDNSIVENWGHSTLNVIEINGFKYRDLNKNGELDKYEDRRNTDDERINDLLEQMSVKEKAGLMFHPSIFFPKMSKRKDSTSIYKHIMKRAGKNRKLIEGNSITHMVVMQGARPRYMAFWQNEVQKIGESTRLGIPVTFSSDPRHGFREQSGIAAEKSVGFSVWPEQIGLGAIGDPKIAMQFGQIANQEYRAIGIRTALHPMADLATEPRWSRTVGTFGEDADLSAELTWAYMKGFQGKTFGEESVSCMIKHFSGGGPQEDGWDPHLTYGRNQVYPGGNFDYHIKPFVKAIKDGCNQIMPYYGIPMGQTSEDVAYAYNKDVLHGMLRNDLGFEGVICADWTILTDKPWGVDSLSLDELIIKSLDAGIDQWGGETCVDELVSLVERNLVKEERINQSVKRILKIKFEMGLFDNPFVDENKAEVICGTKEFLDAGFKAQKLSQVLLKNQDNILPLGTDKKVFLHGYADGVAERYATVVENIEEADVILMKLETSYDKSMKKGLEVILHQGSLSYPKEERDAILNIIAQKPTIISMYMDRPAVEPEMVERTNAYIAHFGATDEALLDIIFGKFVPSGKLPFEIPSSMIAVEKQKEDLPYDSENPAFEYGFGLSY